MPKLSVTNTAPGPRGVHHVGGTHYLEAGETFTGDFSEAEAANASSAGHFTITPLEGDPDTVLRPEDEAPDFDAMTDDELHAYIAKRDDKAAHPNTGREKLLAKARGEG